MDSPILNAISLCSGVGMLDCGVEAGLRHLGFDCRHLFYAEREAYPCTVLEARMEEGSLDAAPIWCGDFRQLPIAEFRGLVDIIIAGFPCQDLSTAGRRAGLDGARSGLFFDIADLADACGAGYMLLENVAGIATATATVVDEAEGELEERAAARVLGELADRGWHAEWLTLSASDVGASHGRARWFCFAWREVGHTGLQHQHLQQREDGAKHPGAGGHVADTECAKRRALSVGGTGSQQGHDSGRAETHGGLGIADEVLGNTQDPHGRGEQPAGSTGSGRARLAGTGELMECEFCGYKFPAELGLYGCPDCLGEGFDDVAYTSRTGQQRPELGRACDGHRGGQEAHGPTSQLCGLFAPGPSDPRWAGIIAERPWLTPALSVDDERNAQQTYEATQSAFRWVADGLASSLDFDNRAQQLKCIGNGVVPAQAGLALIQLVKRARVPMNKENQATKTVAEVVAA